MLKRQNYLMYGYINCMKYVLITIFLAGLCFNANARMVKWKMGRLSIEGNQTYSKIQIHSLMDLRPQFLLGGVTFSQSRLRSDVSSIEKFYKSQGFLDIAVHVDSVSRDSIRHRVQVMIRIVEGIRTKINSVQIFSSKGLINTDSIGTKFSCEIGKPLTTQNLTMDTDLLRKNLSNRGYFAAEVKPQIVLDSSNHSADITFDVNEGPKITVADIQVNGLKRVRSKVITRELDFSSGEILTEKGIRKSEQSLYKTNLFNYIRIEPVLNTQSDSSQEYELPDSSYPVAVDVNEADFFHIQGGVGYGSASGPRASLESSYANLFGLGHSVILRGNLSVKEQRIEGIYYTPWFFGLPIQFNGTLYLDRHNDLKETYYGILRGLRLALGRSTSNKMLYQAWFNWEEISDLVDSTHAATPEIPIKSLGISMTYDTRNDLINPEKGIYNLIQTEIAGLTRNSTKFVKITDDFRALWKIGALTFGSGFRLGWIKPFGDSDTIPTQVLFYAGGARSVRGFKEDRLRSNDNNVGLNGTLLATANLLEVRFPLFWWFQGAAFADCGYLWGTEADRDKPLSFKNTRWTAGPGIRLTTPIAVVRFDMGFKLDRRPGENLFELHFDLGQAF